MTAYYNENDPKAAAWLRELIKGGHIAPGDVDERSIEDVLPNDLRSYTQCHFFAGIGGWSYALRLAGWPDERPVWTGSCPCQPFSAAGKGGGFADERHLWPAWFHLSRICRPPVIFGEQVASAMRWIDLVQADLEKEDYSCGYAVLGAHSVGAPHIRQRLYWVADSQGSDRGLLLQQRGPQQDCFESVGGGEISVLGDANDAGSQGRGECGHCADERPSRPSGLGGELAYACGGDAGAEREQRGREYGLVAQNDGASKWDVAQWLPCTDGKWRPVEPGTFPLAHGVPGRVGLLRGYGNAIVPQVAAAFIVASDSAANEAQLQSYVQSVQ